MAEYINREELLKDINDSVRFSTRNGVSAELRGAHKIVDCIRSAPACDVVKVVRKPVNGYEEYYEVDQFGRVYSVDRVVSVKDNGRVYDKPLKGKQMKQSVHTKGYKTVSLTKDGKTKTVFVHRIVAEAFIPNTENLPMVNHKDEDKTNNFVENLEWCSASYNRTYGRAIEKQAKKLKGRKHTEEEKAKISASMKKYRDNERAEKGYCDNGKRKADDFCPYGERRSENES
jgi:hypothetical protein